MNPEQRENFRKALLQVLGGNASERFGLSVTAIQIFMGQFGFRAPGIADLNAELQYLEDKTFVATVGKTLSPENRCWRITAHGRDYIASNE